MMRNWRYRFHIWRLGKKYNIKIIYRRGRGQAQVNNRVVYCNPIRSRFAYLVALHEIGHVVAVDMSLSKLDRELEAWYWAIDNRKSTLTYIDRQRICSLLWRHYVQAGKPIPAGMSIAYEDMMKWWNGS